MTTLDTTHMVRPLSAIARDIQLDWKKPYFGALPYLDAMSKMGMAWEKYGADDGESIVRYFLSNAATWRGEKAKAIKAELRRLIGG